LDAFGKPSNTSTIDSRWWDSIRTVMPFPIRQKRSLCQYLVDESEDHGLHLYMHMSLHVWFRQMSAQHAFAQTVQDRNRTLFVCFDQLSSLDTQQHVVHHMIQHWWPGGQNFRLSELQSSNSNNNNGTYAGGHSTQDVAADYKASLRERVMELDRRFYSGEVARINALFDCRVA
jgi:hypothetical protein